MDTEPLPPQEDSSTVGVSFLVRRRLRSRQTIAIAERDGVVTLLGPGTDRSDIPTADLSSAKPGDWHPSPARSLAWRLVEAAKAAETSDALDWDAAVLREAAGELARQTVRSSRLLAIDGLEKGALDVLGLTSLSDTERAWLLALHLAKSNPSAALDEVCKLPHDRYAGKVYVIARSLSSIPITDGLRAELMEHLEAFREDPLADLLWQHLGESQETLQDWVRGTRALLQLLPPDSDVSKLGRALLEISEGSSASVELSSIGPAATVLAAWRTANEGSPTPLTATAASLLSAPWSVIDDLIDAGVFTRDMIDSPASLTDDVRRYLLGRLAPEELDDGDIQALKFQGESARRAYLSGDSNQLAGADERTTSYRLLHQLRAGDIAGVDDLIPLLTDEAGETVRALVGFMENPSVASLKDEFLVDRSTWPTAAAVASRAELKITARSRLGEQQRRFLEWAALNEARSRLYGWDWHGALEQAKRCLQVSQDEHVRDEALNLLACAHHQLGRELEAIQALETALEGEYTAALQSNIGVVAADLDPKTAAEHLGRLVVEAPTLGLRVAAAKRAVDLWRSAPEPWEQDEEGEEVLPVILRDALRSLAQAPLSREDFRTIVRLLAHQDSEWIKNKANLQASPHKDSIDAQLFTALAGSYPEFIKTLAPALKKHPGEKWLIEERDGLVDAAIRAVIDDEPSIGAALFGVEIIEAQMPLEPERRIPLIAFSVAALTANIDSDEGEPLEKFLDWLIMAQKELPSLDEEVRDRCKGPLEFAFHRISLSIGSFRENQLGEVIEAYVDITNQLQGMMRRNINREAVRGATDPLINFTSDTRRILKKLLPFVVDPELKRGIEAVEQKTAEVQAALLELPR